jgi:hypothetical protein
MRRRFVAPVVIVLATLTGFGPALAQEGSAAARAFQTGTQAYAHGEFRAAAAAFDEAYVIAPKGAAAYNGGLAWEAAGESARAADDYARALRSADLGTVERADTTGRLKALEARIGRLSVFAADDAEVTVDGVEVTERAKGMHVMPGTHAIRVRDAGGHVETRSVRVAAGDLVEVRLAHADTPPPAEAPPPSPAPSSQEPRKPTTPATEAPSPVSTTRVLSYVAVGGAVVATGVAITTYELGLSALGQFEGGQDQSNSLRSQAENLRTATWVSWGFAGALAATGVILFLVSPSSSSADSHPTAIELLPAGIRVRVGF